jgi:hypothetical protein
VWATHIYDLVGVELSSRPKDWNLLNEYLKCYAHYTIIATAECSCTETEPLKLVLAKCCLAWVEGDTCAQPPLVSEVTSTRIKCVSPQSFDPVIRGVT